MAFPAAADAAVVLQPGKTAARLSNAGGSDGAGAVHPEFAFACGDWTQSIRRSAPGAAVHPADRYRRNGLQSTVSAIHRRGVD
jgi:hypothetical protein